MKRSIYILLITLLSTSGLKAQNPMSIHASGEPKEFQEAGGELYFTARTGPFPAGTELHMVSTSGVVSADLFPEGEATFLTEFAGVLYFVGTSSSALDFAGSLYSYHSTTGLVSHGIRVDVIAAAGGSIYLTAGRLSPTIENDTLYSYSGLVLTNLGLTHPGTPFHTFNGLIPPSGVQEYAGEVYFTSWSSGELYKLTPSTVPPRTLIHPSVWGMVVHDSKLFFGDGTDLLSWDGTSVTTEFSGVRTFNGSYLSNMVSLGTGLYFLGDTTVSGPSGSLYADLIKFDGSGLEVIDDAVLITVGSGTDFDPNGYVTAVGSHIYYGGSSLPIRKLIDGVSHVVVEDQSPEFLVEFDGKLYYEADYIPAFPSLHPQAPEVLGIYQLSIGPVSETFVVDSVGGCEPETDTYKVYFEAFTHSSDLSGSYEVRIWEDDLSPTPGGVVDTLSFTFAETVSPQILEVTLPSGKFYGGGEGLSAKVAYTNSDPATIDIAGLFSSAFFSVDFSGAGACYGCDLEIEFGEQTCTSPGVYDQEVTLKWAEPYPDEAVFDVLINGVAYPSPPGLIDSIMTVTISGLVADGSFMVFEVNLSDAGGLTPCIMSDSIVSPICECSMSYEYVGPIFCDPEFGFYDMEITLIFDTPPTTGLIDFGEFAGPIGTSPMSVFFDGLPPDGMPIGHVIAFTDAPTCGTIAGWVAPGPDCLPVVDCPGLFGDFGGPCDDMDPETDFDIIQPDCTCSGTESDCADINGDGMVDIIDFIAFNSAFGTLCDCPEDLNGDGIVDIEDFLDLNSQFGGTCGEDEGGLAPQTLSPELFNELRKKGQLEIHPELQKGMLTMDIVHEVSIYPNPIQFGQVNIVLTGFEITKSDIDIKVIDLIGRNVEIENESAREESTFLSIRMKENIGAGVYFLIIESDGQSVSKKFMVR